MHEMLVTIFLSAGALVASFFAGLRWRDRRREREAEVVEAAVCGLAQRVERIERTVLLSDEI